MSTVHTCLSQPRLSEPRLFEPRLSEPRLFEPRLFGPRLFEPRLFEPRLSKRHVICGTFLYEQFRVQQNFRSDKIVPSDSVYYEEFVWNHH